MAVITQTSRKHERHVVIMRYNTDLTNSAILMPWIDEVDAVMQYWYGGQQVGLALERLPFGICLD
jgi:beta-glucosidase